MCNHTEFQLTDTPVTMPNAQCPIDEAKFPISVTMGEVPTRKHPKWRNRTSDREYDGIFEIEKPSFLFAFYSNHKSVSLSLGDTGV